MRVKQTLFAASKKKCERIHDKVQNFIGGTPCSYSYSGSETVAARDGPHRARQQSSGNRALINEVCLCRRTMDFSNLQS